MVNTKKLEMTKPRMLQKISSKPNKNITKLTKFEALSVEDSKSFKCATQNETE